MGKPTTEVVKVPVTVGKAELSALGGAKLSDEFNNSLLDGLMKALPQSSPIFGEALRQQAYTASAIGQAEGAPQDVFEAMLIAQAQVAHAAANELHRLAWLKDQPFEVKSRYLALSDKSQRTLVTLIEALDRHRNRGQPQKMKIEHIHVNAGAQAVIGNVTGGGGAAGK